MENQTQPIGKQWSLFKDWSTPETLLTLRLHELEFIAHVEMMQYVNEDHNPHLHPVKRINELQSVVHDLIAQEPVGISNKKAEVLLSPVEIKILYEGLKDDSELVGNDRLDEFYHAVPDKIKAFLTNIETPAFMKFLQDEDYSDEDRGHVNDKAHFIYIASFATSSGIDHSESRYVQMTHIEALMMVRELEGLWTWHDEIMSEGETSSYAESLYRAYKFMSQQVAFLEKALKNNIPDNEMFTWLVTNTMCYLLFSKVNNILSGKDTDYPAGFDENQTPFFQQRLQNDYPAIIGHPLDGYLMKHDSHPVDYHFTIFRL